MFRSLCLALSASVIVLSVPAFADTDNPNRLSQLEDRVASLEAMNARLIDLLEEKAGSAETAPVRLSQEEIKAASKPTSKNSGLVGVSSKYSYDVLDHAENVNTKQLLQLKARQSGELNDRVTLGGGVTAIANYQRSNKESKFGYLMRNPTSANQIGRDVSEAVIHSAQLQTTVKLSDDLTGYVEYLYNPEQSFGSGTIVDLNRNQVQVRRAYLMYGNLDKSPVYAAIGKMDTPFGLNDTVSPFTNSTVWHSFSGLANGAKVGYYKNGLHVRAMAIQGGAQFRAANVPVQDTNVPSRLNNFAADANYTFGFGDNNSVMIGGSYTAGTPYCQGYPIFHFNPCEDNNPAYAIYSKADLGKLTLIGEYVETDDVWPGTQIPDPTNPLSRFGASKVTSFGFGGRYAFDIGQASPLNASLEFSRFKAGPSGAPWERQDQYVAGLSYFVTPSVDLFGEYIHVDGFAPLNFLTGGNFPDGSTWSERDAKTDVFMLGAQAAF